MPLKIMLYLSLFSPGKYTSCQEDFKYPDDDFFSFLCFFFLFSVSAQRLPFRWPHPCPGCGLVSALPAQTLLQAIAYTNRHSVPYKALQRTQWPIV